MANTNCFHAAPPGRKKIILSQCLFFDGRRVVPDERLIYYPTRNVSQVDEYLFRSVTQLVKQMCCLLTEYMSYLPEFGGSTAPNPLPYAYVSFSWVGDSFVS